MTEQKDSLRVGFREYSNLNKKEEYKLNRKQKIQSHMV